MFKISKALVKVEGSKDKSNSFHNPLGIEGRQFYEIIHFYIQLIN